MEWTQVIFQSISVLLGAMTAVLLHRGHKLNAQLDNLNAQMGNLHGQLRKATEANDRMRAFGESTMSLNYDYVDTVLLGPRDAGKSSLVKVWSEPWTIVQEVAPTPNNMWSTVEFSVHEFEPAKRFDDTFGFERFFRPVLRMRVRDYPGEDHLRIPAIRDIKKLDRRVVLVFVLKVGFADGEFAETARNEGYFSKAFVDEIETILVKIGGVVARVVVVFNKVDLMSEPLPDQETVEYLKLANRQVINRLESTFGGLIDYVAVSAETNRNAIKLLGLIASTAILTAADEVKLDAALKAIEAGLRKHD